MLSCDLAILPQSPKDYFEMRSSQVDMNRLSSLVISVVNVTWNKDLQFLCIYVCQASVVLLILVRFCFF